MSFRDQDAHKQRRKLLSCGFSQASMLDFEGHMTSKIQNLQKSRWEGCSVEQARLRTHSYTFFGVSCVKHLSATSSEKSSSNARVINQGT